MVLPAQYSQPSASFDRIGIIGDLYVLGSVPFQAEFGDILVRRDRVFTIERNHKLSQHARRVLESLGYTNVLTRVGDGTIGWTEFAPYDRIIVTAGAPDVPVSLIKQLAEGGFMVVPTGDRIQQDLKVVTKTDSGVKIKSGGGCVFVPLIGKEGWSNG